MENPYLSVIIPAYNEAERLPKTLLAVDKYLSGASFPYEIIVVNDGSKDTTAQVVQNMAATIKNLKLVTVEHAAGQKRGMTKGNAVKVGLLAGQGSIRLFTDADNSTSLDQFDKMKPFFDQGYHVVIGDRAIKGSLMDPAEPWYRRLPGQMGNLLIQLTNLPGIWDTQCGFKAFTAEATQRIFPLSRIAGWGFDIEILSLARFLGYKIKEVPVHWVNDARSHVKLSAYFQVLIDNFRIRWWFISGSYKRQLTKKPA